MTLLDVVAAHDFGEPNVESVAANITDPAVLERFVGPETDSVFHLAEVDPGFGTGGLIGARSAPS
jgi:hypothetical protein